MFQLLLLAKGSKTDRSKFILLCGLTSSIANDRAEDTRQEGGAVRFDLEMLDS